MPAVMCGELVSSRRACGESDVGVNILAIFYPPLK